MTDEKKTGRKTRRDKEKPEEDSFGLDIGFEEALERFLKVDPGELDETENSSSQKSKGSG